jgi:hypothetical protein
VSDEPVTLKEIFEDQVHLAEIYCAAGEFRTGARLLRKLADKLEVHADEREAALADLRAAL